MSLPIVLQNGMIAVYGPGSPTGSGNGMPSGMILPPNYRFGTVYNIWDGGLAYVYSGDVVYWDESVVNPTRVVSVNPINTYTIIPARLATQDNTVV